MNVTIVDRLGVPVRPVMERAPLVNVVDNGAPVVISSRGVPLVLKGYSPEPEAPPFDDFTVFAGGLGGAGDTGYYTTVYGSISGEPLPGFTLKEFATRSGNYFQIAIEGDCVDTVTGWQPVIDGVDIGPMISEWQFAEGDTTANWGPCEMMASGQSYDVTWVRS